VFLLVGIDTNSVNDTATLDNKPARHWQVELPSPLRIYRLTSGRGRERSKI
jgi:hypothetical protein